MALLLRLQLRCFLWLALVVFAVAPPPLPSEPRVNLVAPVYREYAAVGVLVHAMLAQTDPRWTLTLVSDGPDARIGELVDVSRGVASRVTVTSTATDSSSITSHALSTPSPQASPSPLLEYII